MDSYFNKIKIQYKILAIFYDLMDILVFPKKKYNPRYALANIIPNENIKILEVCIGTGNTSITIGVKNTKNNIIGIDISEDMLKVAKTKIEKKNLKNINTYFMDATNLDFKEEFDVVTTSLSLHEMPSIIMDSVIYEMSRVLKSGGKMYIIEWDKPKKMIPTLLFNFFPLLFEPKGFSVFLKIDWLTYLKKYNLKVEGIEHYSFTKLIIVEKVQSQLST